jgi:hypothetical protein
MLAVKAIQDQNIPHGKVRHHYVIPRPGRFQGLQKEKLGRFKLAGMPVLRC